MSLHGTCCSLLGEFNRVAIQVMQPLLSLYPSPHLFLSLGMDEAWVLADWPDYSDHLLCAVHGTLEIWPARPL